MQRRSPETIAALERDLPKSEMNELVGEILAANLGELGLFRNGISTIADLPLENRVSFYHPGMINCRPESGEIAFCYGQAQARTLYEAAGFTITAMTAGFTFDPATADDTTFCILGVRD